MADLNQYMDEGFDDHSVAASTGVPEPVPEGDYQLACEKTEVTLTKDQTGALLKVTMAVLSGEFEGRKVFEQFNVRNKNMQAQQIGISELKALCLATGVDYEQVKGETDLLLNLPFRARIGFDKPSVNPATNQPYAPKNKVKKYYPAGDTSAPAAVAAPAPKPASAAAAPVARPAMPGTGGSVPWKKPAAAA